MLMKKVALLILVSVIVACILLFAVGIIKLPNKEYNAAKREASDRSLVIAEMTGIDTSKHNIKLDLYRQGMLFNSLPEEIVHYRFESKENTLKVDYNYVEGKLHTLTTSIDRPPRLNRTMTTNLELAQDFLNKYQTFSGATYYSTMLSMLDDIETDKDTTKTVGNIKLQVTQTRSITQIRWTYIENDTEIPVKTVAVYFEQGVLKYFVDKWEIYNLFL